MTIASFNSDRVEVMPPRKADNTTVVKFEVGEYELERLRPLFGLLERNFTVTVEDYAGG